MLKKGLINKWTNVCMANGSDKNLWFAYGPKEVWMWRSFLQSLVLLGTLTWEAWKLAQIGLLSSPSECAWKHALKVLTYLIHVLYFSENMHLKTYVILSKILLSKHRFLKFKTKDIIASWKVLEWGAWISHPPR